ncbi:MAG: aldo/keto reductase [Paludibacteraceae bacterium]|nr:aldo/keto reductase [Paludibacteraceae bacterium]
MMKEERNNVSRRDFLKIAAGATAATALAACGVKSEDAQVKDNPVHTGKKTMGEMTYRETTTTHDRVSLLGFGCMRFPTVEGESAREGDAPIDQEAVNAMIDYAMEHGVNYYDTSPAYCKGHSEEVVGKALSRHPREKYFVATKLSNFSPDTWSREESLKIYHNSFKYLQVDYVDYMLLHAIGMNGMEEYNKRYVDNGMLDFLLEERKAGRIRNLGFSYHGDVEVFDYLLSKHDEYHWDFVQIQMNYVDWTHAKEVNERNTNAEYLYAELDKRNIPVVIMEPLLGGRLATLPNHLSERLKSQRPDDSIASWAFRYLGTFPRILTVLSGMTYMEHLKDNLLTYSPLEPLSDDEMALVYDVAKNLVEYPLVPCTGCQYCMPCPYGLDIPTIFKHYNTCVQTDHMPDEVGDPEYKKLRRAYLVGYDRSVPKERQANHCIGCGRCMAHCPQGIIIPREMRRIDAYVEKLKQGK